MSEVTPLFFTVTTGWDREDEAGGGQPNSPGSYRTAQEEENRLWRDQFCKSSVNFTFTGKREFFSLLLLLPYEHWFVFSTRIPKILLRYLYFYLHVDEYRLFDEWWLIIYVYWQSECVFCLYKDFCVCLQSGSGGLSVSNGGSSSSKTVWKFHWISKQVNLCILLVYIN